MAEEETTVIREITFSPYHGNSTIDEVISMLRDLTPTEKIHLLLSFMNRDRFRFSETVELRELVLEKKSNIHHLKVIEGFDFLVQFLLANNGETKHFTFSNCLGTPMQLEQATGLSNAIRSNNSGHIESFFFSGLCESSEVLQSVWDALLATRVRDLNFCFHFSGNNDVNDGNNIDFSNISNNTLLKELEVNIPSYGRNLFDSIKGNTTVEKLIVSTQYIIDANLDSREKKAFIEMLIENTTLMHVELMDGHFNRIFREEINIHTTLNKIWKRLIIVKRKERIATAAAAVIRNTTTNVAATTATDDDASFGRRREQNHNVDEVKKNEKIEEEKKMIKKKKEMKLWLKTFEKKPTICNELIYLFLNENADMYNNNVGSSIVVGDQRKRKRKK